MVASSAILGCASCCTRMSNQKTERSSLVARPKKSLSPASIPLWMAIAIVLAWYTATAAFFRHWEGWGWADCFYFSSVIITTVGYGDDVPTNDVSKVVTMLVVFSGMTIVITCLARIASQLQTVADEAGRKQDEAARDHLQMRAFKRELASSIAVLLLVVLVGALFMRVVEKYSWVDCFYWALVSSTAIGFGDLDLHEATHVFCIFYLPIAVLSFGQAASRLVFLMLQLENVKRIDDFVAQGVTSDMLSEMDTDGSGYVDKFDFVTYMLAGQGKVDPSDVQKMAALFKSYDKDGNGRLDTADIRNLQSAAERSAKEYA